MQLTQLLHNIQVKQVPILNTNIVVELFIYDCAGQTIFNQLDLNSKYVRQLGNIYC